MDSRSDNGRRCPPGQRGLAWVVLALALALPAAALEPTLVSIGTGGSTGVYYLAGGAICELVDDRRWETGVRCLAETSDGSIQNLRDVRSGARTFGIVQSDWQYHAVNGTSVFGQAGPDHELRSIFSLFREPFTVVARPDAGIAALARSQGQARQPRADRLRRAGDDERGDAGAGLDRRGLRLGHRPRDAGRAACALQRRDRRGGLHRGASEPDRRGHDLHLQRGAGAGGRGRRSTG